MKSKKTMGFFSLLTFSLLLAGCMGPALPKEAYLESMRAIETADSLEKTSRIQLNLDASGLWEEQETVLFSLLNETDIHTNSYTDRVKGIRSTEVVLSGGFSFMPLDATLQIQEDISNNKTYLDGNSLHEVLESWSPGFTKKTNQWLELNAATHLLSNDFSTVFAALPEEKFIRREVTLEEKKEGIRDVIAVYLNTNQMQQAFPELKNVQFEGVTFQVFLDRKGRLVKEDMTTKFRKKEAKKELVVHGSVISSYTKVNEPVSVPPLPKKEHVTTLEAFLKETTKTEKP